MDVEDFYKISDIIDKALTANGYNLFKATIQYSRIHPSSDKLPIGLLVEGAIEKEEVPWT